MQFDSFTFIVFFILVVILYSVLADWGQRKTLLLLASYLFYAAWNPLFLPLLIGSSTLDWWMAQKMDSARSPLLRKIWLISIVLISLGLLAYFKYSYFVLENTGALFELMGLEYRPKPFEIILPIGISFYTFHSLSYCIDIYKKRFPVVKNWRDYALYVSFFPQLVAGPIVRWSEMKAQIELPRSISPSGVNIGLCLMIIGLFQKIVLADNVFSPVSDALFNAPAGKDGAAAWVGALAFSGQIYCDFAGYTTCALGAALVLGFRLPVNFKSPYAAVGFTDFWRRWHISLSTWLRDYLYIPLGGDRRGALLTCRNLMLTMLIGGLWHGAAWTFIVWGGLHGGYLVIERWMRRQLDSVRLDFPKPVMLAVMLALTGLTFFLTVVAWVWFRALSMADGWAITKQMLNFADIISWNFNFSGKQWLAIILMALLVVIQWNCKSRELGAMVSRAPVWALSLLMAVMLALIVLSPGESNAFIYFQF